MNGSIDPPSCTDIIVVRHGETDWNAIGKIQVDFSNLVGYRFTSFLCYYNIMINDANIHN